MKKKNIFIAFLAVIILCLICSCDSSKKVKQEVQFSERKLVLWTWYYDSNGYATTYSTDDCFFKNVDSLKTIRYNECLRDILLLEKINNK